MLSGQDTTMLDKRNIKRFSILYFCIILCGIYSVQGSNYMDTFKWLPTECADKQFPMQIIEGDFIFKNGNPIYIPFGKVVHNGWGERGSVHIVGDDYKPIPEKLYIYWFSYMEDSFYSGIFDLPFDNISRLFHNGIVRPGTEEKSNYNRIIVGLAPRGAVSLWLSGDGIVTEVAFFQADVVKGDWLKIINNPNVTRSQFIQMMIESQLGKEQSQLIQKSNIPEGRWSKRFREKYQWAPQIEGTNKPQSIWLFTYNGEREFINCNKLEDLDCKLRAVPKKVKINWQNDLGKEYTKTLIFDENEIYEAYHKFYNYNSNDKLFLRFQINKRSYEIKAFLLNSKFVLELIKVKQ